MGRPRLYSDAERVERERARMQTDGYKEAHKKGRFIGPLIPLVYGFHTPANWQSLSKSANSIKGNRDWPCAPWHK